MSWTVAFICGLCSARTPYEKHDDYKVASAACEAHATRLGFIMLPDVALPGGRVRFGQTVCVDCAADIIEASAPVAAPAVPS